MNRTLLTFAALLILLGIGFGIYTVSIFGGLLLIPALLPAPRQATRPAPQPQRHETRRITPPPAPQPQPAATSAPVAPPMTQSPTPSQTYPQALFPTNIFPSLSPMSSAPQMLKEPDKKPEERDELIEIGAMLALLKLALG